MTQQNENKLGHSVRGLGALETLLMEALWAAEAPLTVQEVLEALGPGHNYKTVMTVLNRLVEKELLQRALDGRAYRYHPLQSREQFLRSVADELVRGYINAYGAQSGSYLAQAVNAVAPLAAMKPRAESPNGVIDAHDKTTIPTPPRPLYYDETHEQRPRLATIIGVAAVLQVITLLFRRKN
jgi:predicted transcriptional regulator